MIPSQCHGEYDLDTQVSQKEYSQRTAHAEAVVERMADQARRPHCFPQSLDIAFYNRTFTEAQAMIIVQACQFWSVTAPEGAKELWMMVRDFITGCDDQEHNRDAAAAAELVQMLQRFSKDETMAVAFAAGRFFAQPKQYGDRSNLIAVGLIRRGV